jgi:hypothetical protein
LALNLSFFNRESACLPICVVATWKIRHPLDAFFHFSFLIKTVGRTPWTEDQPLPTHRTTQTQKNILASSGIRAHDPSVRGDEDTVFHALERAATVIS